MPETEILTTAPDDVEPLELAAPVPVIEVDTPPDGDGTLCADEDDGTEVLGHDDDFDYSTTEPEGN